MLSKLLWLCLIFAGMPRVLPAEEQGKLTSTAEIVRRMQEYIRRRAESLQGYTSSRTYHIEYDGIVKKNADMTARMTYTSKGGKSFEIKSESGSKLLRSQVLRKILETEASAAQPSSRQESAITPENYDFHLLPGEDRSCSDCYVLEAIPRQKTKLLFVGKIWVDSRDFAITRIEGRPAVNPSWWIKEPKFLQIYRKVGNFWMYDTNESTSKIRIGGKAVLRIRYGEYELR